MTTYTIAHTLLSPYLFQRASGVNKHVVGFSDVGIHHAVFEIIEVNHRCPVRFLPTDQEDTSPDGRDRYLNSLKDSLEGTLDIRKRHFRLGMEVKMEDPASEIRFVYVADGWKVRHRHKSSCSKSRFLIGTPSVPVRSQCNKMSHTQQVVTWLCVKNAVSSLLASAASHA
jgi:hypothetical protein